MRLKHLSFGLVLALATATLSFTSGGYEIAILKYNGGGDWYANPTALTNLIAYCNKNLGTNIATDYRTVEVGSPDLLNYPFVHMTGHGNVEWSESEVSNLQTYLRGGGFLHIDDNYGMDAYIRPQLTQLIPEGRWVELAADHPIFHHPFDLPNGLPKIHEHDNGSPQAFAIFIDDRMVLLYTFETDLSDGWEDPEVHNDPAELREKALQMGANILSYAFNGSSYAQTN